MSCTRGRGYEYRPNHETKMDRKEYQNTHEKEGHQMIIDIKTLDFSKGMGNHGYSWYNGSALLIIDTVRSFRFTVNLPTSRYPPTHPRIILYLH